MRCQHSDFDLHGRNYGVLQQARFDVPRLHLLRHRQDRHVFTRSALLCTTSNYVPWYVSTISIMHVPGGVNIATSNCACRATCWPSRRSSILRRTGRSRCNSFFYRELRRWSEVYGTQCDINLHWRKHPVLLKIDINMHRSNLPCQSRNQYVFGWCNLLCATSHYVLGQMPKLSCVLTDKVNYKVAWICVIYEFFLR